MAVTFDYGPWDPTTESIPQRKGSTGTEVRLPFTPGFLMDALLLEVAPPRGDRFRRDLISTLQACLTIAINRFRQLGVPAGDLQRLVKAYPTRGKVEEQVLLDAALAPASRISNPNNLVVATDPSDKYEVRQDATRKIWTWHPKV